tara:strand:- start:1921 stop:2913 length:993 start_codon:yes stop_codon:yes gene_type:complete
LGQSEGGFDIANPIIQIRGLRKLYGPHVALDGVDLDIGTGGVGILGPNGSGKSTLFKCILGLIRITEGGGEVLGKDIATMGPDIRSKIGYMAEYDSLDPGLTAVDQVRYAGELLGMRPDQATQRAHEVLQYVGLQDQRYRKIESFSTGMRQATKLACAIVHDPQILFCDEPTNGLDASARQFMLDTLRRTISEGGGTVIMTSHVMEDIQGVCDRVVMLSGGKVVVEGRIDELARQITREIEISVWGGATKLEQWLLLHGHKVRRMGRIMRIEHQGDQTVRAILEGASETGAQVRVLREFEPDLEDIFLLIMRKLGRSAKSASELKGVPRK